MSNTFLWLVLINVVQRQLQVCRIHLKKTVDLGQFDIIDLDQFAFVDLGQFEQFASEKIGSVFPFSGFFNMGRNKKKTRVIR